MAMLNIRIASCRPLYDIFDANRLLLCRHAMDPLNGLWFSGLMCLVLWALATPLALGLVNLYRRMVCARGLSHTNSHQYGYMYFIKRHLIVIRLRTGALFCIFSRAPSDSLIISEQSRWTSSR